MSLLLIIGVVVALAAGAALAFLMTSKKGE
jgi:flagellar basal body-associated protein FliL